MHKKITYGILAAAFIAAVILAIIYNDKVLLIAGIYWGIVAIVNIAFFFIDRRQREIDDNYRAECEGKEAEEAAAEDAEDFGTDEKNAGEDEYIRESFGTGKGSNLIGTVAAIAVIAINLALWLILEPVDQTVVGAVAYILPFNWMGAIVVTIFEAIIVYVGAIDIYEIIVGVAKEHELEKEKTTKAGTAVFTMVVIVIAILLVVFCRYTYEIITEDGYEFHSPAWKSYSYEWDNMVSFKYNDEALLSWPVTYVEFNDEKQEFKSFELHTFR